MTFGLQATPSPSDILERAIWRGIAGQIADEREVIFPEEQIGVFGGGLDRTYIAKLMASMDVPETELTFEQGDWLFLAAGLVPQFTDATGVFGSQQGLSNTVTQQLTVPTFTAPTTYAYGVTSGDNAESEEMGHALTTDLTISFAGGEAVKISGNMMGAYGTRAQAPRGTTGEFTELTNVEAVLAGRGTVRFAIGSVGFTQVPVGNILGGEVTFTPRWEPKFFVDSGVLYYEEAVFTGIDIEGNLMYEQQATGSYSAAGSAGQVERFRNQTAQAMWLEFAGGTIPNGTTFANKTFRMILPFKWSEVDALDDMNGNDTRTISFKSHYNPAYPELGRGTVLIVRSGTFEHNYISGG